MKDTEHTEEIQMNRAQEAAAKRRELLAQTQQGAVEQPLEVSASHTPPPLVVNETSKEIPDHVKDVQLLHSLLQGADRLD